MKYPNIDSTILHLYFSRKNIAMTLLYGCKNLDHFENIIRNIGKIEKNKIENLVIILISSLVDRINRELRFFIQEIITVKLLYLKEMVGLICDRESAYKYSEFFYNSISINKNKSFIKVSKNYSFPKTQL